MFEPQVWVDGEWLIIRQVGSSTKRIRGAEQPPLALHEMDRPGKWWWGNDHTFHYIDNYLTHRAIPHPPASIDYGTGAE